MIDARSRTLQHSIALQKNGKFTHCFLVVERYKLVHSLETYRNFNDLPYFNYCHCNAYRNRKYISETAHNIAIVFWISANSYWMISEFAGFDTKLFYHTYTYKHLAVIPFGIGIFILAWYYLWWAPRAKKQLHVTIMNS